VRVTRKLKSARQALTSAEARRRAREAAPSVLRRLWSFAFSLILVLAILVVWNVAQNLESQRGRLWGELLFVVLVIWFALVVLSSLAARTIRRVGRLKWLRIYPISRPEALVWAGVTVVTVPLAVLFRLGSVVVLGVSLGLAALALLFLRRRTGWIGRLPYFSASIVASLALVAAAWIWRAPGLENVSPAPATPAVSGAESLARHFRPLLFLDSTETFPPVNIEAATMHGCTQGLGAEHCDNPVNPSDPLDEFDYVTLPGTKLEPGEKPGGPTSAYYHHVVEDQGKVYIDYWWYFARNPAPVARGALCGQALRWLSEACAEHPADWEGITLVLVPCRVGGPTPECFAAKSRSFRVLEARYAQHEKVVKYPWRMLQNRWREPGYAAWYGGAGQRPLVFVALHSHASYAGQCGRCDQIVHPSFKERRNGRLHWTNNTEDGCGTDCLKALPVDESGAPAQWNAFPGRWGTQQCILFGSYCDVQRAPRAPSFQDRYRELECPPELCLTSEGL
jgi:hypothetical protein